MIPSARELAPAASWKKITPWLSDVQYVANSCPQIITLFWKSAPSRQYDLPNSCWRSLLLSFIAAWMVLSRGFGLDVTACHGALEVPSMSLSSLCLKMHFSAMDIPLFTTQNNCSLIAVLSFHPLEPLSCWMVAFINKLAEYAVNMVFSISPVFWWGPQTKGKWASPTWLIVCAYALQVTYYPFKWKHPPALNRTI